MHGVEYKNSTITVARERLGQCYIFMSLGNGLGGQADTKLSFNKVSWKLVEILYKTTSLDEMVR